MPGKNSSKDAVLKLWHYVFQFNEKTVSSLLLRCKWTLTCCRKIRQMIARNQFFKEVIYACNDLTRFKVMFLNYQTKNNFETLQVWLIIMYREWCKIAVELAKKKLGGGLRYISGINHFPLLAPLVVQGLRLNFESGIASNYFIWIQSLNTEPLQNHFCCIDFTAFFSKSRFTIRRSFTWNFAKKIGLVQS